jgi:hypothetical protein
MAREVQRNDGVARAEQRRVSASESSSETMAPIDRPSLARRALTSRRMGAWISNVVRMMFGATAEDI